MSQDEEGKLFVGGVAQITTPEKMQQYFSKFGEVVESTILVDKETGNHRGFGFVKFKNPQIIDTVLQSRPHVLDGKQIDPKPCTPKEIQKQKKLAEKEHIQKYRVFIGGLTQSMTADNVKAFFEKFGPVTEVVFAIHKESKQNKGFGFVTFEKESSATEAVNAHFHDIEGKRVEAKKAEPRERMRSIFQTAKQGGGAGGDNNMMMQNNSNMGYGPGPNYGGGQMPWMGGYSMGPSGGYMPPTNMDSGYGTYGGAGYGYSSNGNYSSANYSAGNYTSGNYSSSNYASGYDGSSYGGGYSDMGKYPPQQSNYSSAKATSRPSGQDSRGYHPYKR